ncbi:MAG: hypothetical protein M1818_005151 [Claussenomyces sp. TS43310]|nr:MAG: hypothetical protein M1818_005151 [Claussenomyces sp. TS43310]
MSSHKMKHITPESLEDLPSRVAYLKSFLHFTASDVKALNSATPLIAPLIPGLLDAVYGKLLKYDITAAVFIPKNTDFEGETPKGLEDLSLEHPQIAMRKDFFKNYLVRLLFTSDFDDNSPFWKYLNNVGIMHTGRPGFKHRESRPELRVDYIHMGLTLSYVSDVILNAVMKMDDVPFEKRLAVVRAFNKVIWMQNDLFARHYINDAEPESKTPTA